MQDSNTELPFMEAKVKKRTKSSSPVKMQNEILKFTIFRYEKGTPKIITQIYSKRKSSDSPGSFRFKRTREINFTALSKII